MQHKVRINGMVRIDAEWLPLNKIDHDLMPIVEAVAEQGAKKKVLLPPYLPSNRIDGKHEAIRHYMTHHGCRPPSMLSDVTTLSGVIETEDMTRYIGHVAAAQGYAGWDDYHAWYVDNVLRVDKGRGAPPEYETLWPVILSAYADEGIQDGSHRFHQYVLEGEEYIPFIAFPDEGAAVLRMVRLWMYHMENSGAYPDYLVC